MTEKFQQAGDPNTGSRESVEKPDPFAEAIQKYFTPDKVGQIFSAGIFVEATKYGGEGYLSDDDPEGNTNKLNDIIFDLENLGHISREKNSLIYKVTKVAEKKDINNSPPKKTT